MGKSGDWRKSGGRLILPFMKSSRWYGGRSREDRLKEIKYASVREVGNH